ncbi:hypothetical protein L596_022387 [Steinernema carpocapsae]|uniref:Homeobox domain-containing protein n=1 Tax=Steinernema carpocapsae TaxID=34508 RepID=A0A4U5MLL3_STECR|nr:hypothetical protein L596_022387 [Steinernema carpocapsae]
MKTRQSFKNTRKVASLGIKKPKAPGFFIEEQRSVLNEWLTTVKYVNAEKRRHIAESTGLMQMQVYSWFNLRRHRNPLNVVAEIYRPRKHRRLSSEQIEKDQTGTLRQNGSDGFTSG